MKALITCVGLPLLVTVMFAGAARAQTATQEISLSEGWNAVWLDVEPTYQSGTDAGLRMLPSEVFTNPSIEVVATPKPLAGLAEFFGADPATAGGFNQDEWQQWKRTDPSGSNNLPLVSGNRPYLIQVAATTATFSLTITGKARFFRPTWVPDRYNLLGFALEGAPTFEEFFGPSGTAHPVSRIFRLDAAGSWENVTGAQTMNSHEAYWVFADGPSRYMGPVAVDFDLAGLGSLGFGGGADAQTVGSGANELSLDLEELVFTNLGPSAVVPELDLISEDSGSGDLALHVVTPDPAGLGFDRGSQVDAATAAGSATPLGETVASGGTSILTLGAQRLWSGGTAGRENLYRLKTGGGSEFWLPVSAVKSGLSAPADLLPSGAASSAGLWVGEVSVNAATSIVGVAPEVKPTAGTAPLRVLVHSDAGGNLRLLSQVTIMRTKTADPEVPPAQVLVVDPAKIPFFEGVQERSGKLTGIRIATVGYDMPRDTDVAAQSAGAGDLIDMIVAESTSPTTKWLAGATLYADRAAVTAAAIESYLLFRGVRPPGLQENYLLSLPIDGALGAGKTLRTAAGSLVLDPFHRSNPFRHAFHQSQNRGPQITREFEIVFDADQPVSDRLRGSWSETISGLIKNDLTTTGSVVLRRVSAVAELDAAP